MPHPNSSGSFKLPNQQAKNYGNIFKVGKKQIPVNPTALANHQQLSDQGGESSASSQHHMMQSNFEARRRLSVGTAGNVPSRTRSNEDGRPSVSTVGAHNNANMSGEISLPNIQSSCSVSNNQKSSSKKGIGTATNVPMLTSSATTPQLHQQRQGQYSGRKNHHATPQIGGTGNRPSSILGRENKGGHMFANDFYAQNLVVLENDKENIQNNANSLKQLQQHSNLNPQGVSNPQQLQQLPKQPNPRTNL